MNFLWPDALWLLAAIPMLVGGYVALLKRRKRNAVRFAHLDLVRAAAGPAQRLRRHLPPALLLLALAALLVASARPTAVVTLPSDQRTIILAIDVSLSMRATDVDPSRIAAAQTAAKAFVLEQPADVRIGIVTFAGSASVVQAPTQNRDDLVAAIDRFQLQRSTAIGSGIIMSLATLFPDDGIDLEALVLGHRGGRSDGRVPSAIDREPKAEAKAREPVAPGSYPSAAIILLTDGRRTTGPDTLAAAQMAAQRGVRVYTVGFGTAEGSNVGIDGMSIFMRFDEEALKAVAGITQAEYFHAASAADLKMVYDKLNARFVLDRKEIEVSALLAAAAAVLTLLAGGLSLRWFRRIA